MRRHIRNSLFSQLPWVRKGLLPEPYRREFVGITPAYVGDIQPRLNSVSADE